MRLQTLSVQASDTDVVAIGLLTVETASFQNYVQDDHHSSISSFWYSVVADCGRTSPAEALHISLPFQH